MQIIDPIPPGAEGSDLKETTHPELDSDSDDEITFTETPRQKLYALCYHLAQFQERKSRVHTTHTFSRSHLAPFHKSA